MFGIGKDSKKTGSLTEAEDKYWKGLKETVDRIFEGTKAEREKMDANMEQFRGAIWDKDKLDKTQSMAMANFLFSTVQSIAPMLTDTKPTAMVIPRLPEYTKLAKMYTDGLSYTWDALELQNKLNMAVVYAMVKDYAVFEVCYNPDKAFGGDIDLYLPDPTDFFILPGYADEWDCPLMGVRENKPISWVRKNFPDIGEIKPSGAFSKNDGGKENEEKRKAIKFGDSTDYELEDNFVRVYRVWCKDNHTFTENASSEDGKEIIKVEKKYPYGKWVYFTDDQFLAIKPSMDEHGLPPFVKMVDYEDPGNFKGIGENQNIEGLNKEFQLQLQAVVDHARKYAKDKWEVDSERTDPDTVRDNIDSPDTAIFVTDKLTEDGPGIRLVERRQIDSSVPQLITLIQDLIQEVSGVTEISKGEAAKKERQSASEIGVLIESSHTRTRQRIRNVEHTIKRLSYIIVRMMMQYYTEPRSVRVRKDNDMIYSTISNTRGMAQEVMNPGQEVMAKYKSSQNPGRDLPPQQVQDVEDFLKVFKEAGKETDPVYFDFDIEVQSESTLPMDKQTRANQAIKLYAQKGIDRLALLEALNWPDKEAIVERMGKAEQALKAQKGQMGG